jgi:four helix bundle protein
MRPFRELVVWHKAHLLTLELYKVTRTFPREEQYGLTSQMRRAAASICANIAEGCGRGTARDFARFIQMALGSASELEYHLVLAADLGFISADAHSQIQTSVVAVKRMLSGLVRRLVVDSKRTWS